MSKIDYSKWDNIELSSEDESNARVGGSNLKVTKFDAPQQITIGGNNAKLDKESDLGDTEYNTFKEEDCAARDDFCGNSSPKNKIFVSENKNPKLKDYVYCEKSKTTCSYYWTQSENEVKLLIPIEESSSGRDIAVSTNDGSHLEIKTKGRILLSEEFLYEINDNEDCIFWSIVTLEPEGCEDCLNKKMIFIELEKKQIDPKIKVWWKSIFKGGREASIDNFRRLSEKEIYKNTKFKESWKKAHELFKNNIKNKRVNLI